MKTNKLQVLYMLITSLAFAIVFGALVGGDNAAISNAVAGLSFVGGLVLSYGYSESDKKKMAMACGAITSSISVNCADPLTAGVNATFRIANKDDIDSITYDGSNPMLATDITMKAGKAFFVFEGQLQSTEPKFAMVKGKYINTFEHEVAALIFKLDPTTKQQILNLKDGNFVLILENNYTGSAGNTKYEIYGAGSGLKAEVLERTPNDAESLGAFKITLKTQEYAREGKPPVTFYDTDLATTDAAIAAITD